MFSKFTASMPTLPPVNINISNSFKTSIQAGRERLGAVGADEITELPEEYVALEGRVDALNSVHKQMLKITQVYSTESYDYPVQITESVSELGGQISSGWSHFANANLKGTSLPLPALTAPPKQQPKTLPHALSRAAASSSMDLRNGPAGAAGSDAQTEERLSKALGAYSLGMGKVGEARLAQDAEIQQKFLAPWQSTLHTSLAIALKSRAAVKQARLELDSKRQILKGATAAGPKQEQARLDVESAEDVLVGATETAISQMKTVLSNPEPLAALSNLVKSQLIYYASSAEALQAAHAEIEESALAAEAAYRGSRQ